MGRHFNYFAYGSNMLATRLQAEKRCPSARVIGIASAEGYNLEFSKYTETCGSAKANLEKRHNKTAYGVLYEVDISDQQALDRAEGLGKAYYREDSFPVTLINNNGESSEVVAVAYLALETKAGIKPFDWYLALVLAGAQEHKLPDAVIERLYQHAFTIDTDLERVSHIDALTALKKSNKMGVLRALRASKYNK